MVWDICGMVVKFMNKVTNDSFNKIYIFFGSLFVLLSLSVEVFFLIKENAERETFIVINSVYILNLLIFMLIFLFILKSKIDKVIKSIDEIVDNAVNGKINASINYEETSISALENKLYKFINMSQNSTDTITEERNKIKSLISDISHQTKTPVANILLYSELLLDDSSLNEEKKQLARDIKVQSEKLRWLIESLVKMSRLEVGIIAVNKTIVPIFETVSASLKEVFVSAEKKNILIEVFCDENIKAYYDSKWSKEALINILENAIKYTQEGGKIKISVKKYEMFTRIDIADTGIGIHESEYARIFKRFYRSESVAQYEGVGIGLYLTRRILEAQGGYIKVKSELNKGSIFSVFLPNS